MSEQLDSEFIKVTYKKREKMHKQNILFDKEENAFKFLCPYCEGQIIVEKKDIKCKIFRHAVYKKTGRSIKPHTNEKKCQELVVQNKVYGCAKPFKFDGKTVEICDYI